MSSVAVGSDPFGLAAQGSLSVEDADAMLNAFLSSAHKRQGVARPARALAADGRAWHSMGGSQAQELACVLAASLAYLRAQEGASIEPDLWADQISFTLAADADQFGTIAKARAMRKLWAAVLDGSGLKQSPMHLHMETSMRMLTRRDPWVNLLRNSVATFAAGIGGADSISVLPHTLAVGLPDAFARRLARNTQSILLEECNLGKVIDPAAGSGAIENRTDQLCSTAWEIFQDIEERGGLLEALRQGSVQSAIADTRSRLEKDIARRKRPLTGVSEFPNLDEAAVDVLDGRSEIANSWRFAEPFEVLRDAADTSKRDTGSAQIVFLASLGSVADFSTRGAWVANAFAAGGIEAVGLQSYPTLDALREAFASSGAQQACLVSSDAVYEANAGPAAKTLKDVGVKHLYMAGKPGTREAAYRASGVDTFIYAGCDILALLKKAHEDLEVQA